MRRSLLLDVVADIAVPSMLVLSWYLLFAGHNQPGGGFVGGLVAGGAVALRYAAGGLTEARRALPIRAVPLLGVGLTVAVATATAPLVWSAAPMETGIFTRELGPLGSLKVTNALPFDLGVYLVVVAVVALLLETFGNTAEPTDAEGRS